MALGLPERGFSPIASASWLAVLSAAAAGCCAFSGPRHSGPASAHFDGEQFHNPLPAALPGYRELLKWHLAREEGTWRDRVDARPGPRPPARVVGGRLRVTFVNHSTVLIQMNGVNILTDPIWSQRAGPLPWAGPRRARPPGIRFEDLPRIDVVLVTHNHYDHLDLPTLERLDERDRPLFFVGLGNARLLRSRGIRRVWELDWWYFFPVGRGLRVVAVPAQHFSGRGLCDRNATLWAGFVVTGPGGPVYVAGDTGYGPHFDQIGTVYAPIRLAVLPIGAFRPRWFMSRMHISPSEAVRAHRDLRAHTSLGVHFGTFRLADDGDDEPPRLLAAALRSAGIPGERFWVLGFGEGREVPPVPGARGQGVKGSRGQGVKGDNL